MMSRKISLKKFENNPMSLHKKWQYLNAIAKVVENLEFLASFLPEKIPPKKIIIYIMLNSGLVTEVASIARSPLESTILGMWLMSAFLGITML